MLLSRLEVKCSRKLTSTGSVQSPTEAADLLRRCFWQVMIALHEESVSGEAFYLPASVRRLAKLTHEHRTGTSRRYSTRTLVRLFEKSCEHFAVRPYSQLCFVAALRSDSLPVIPHPSYCYFDRYFRLCENKQVLHDLIIPHLAFILTWDSLRITEHRRSDLLVAQMLS